MKKVFKILGVFFLTLIGLVFLIALICIKPLDRKALKETEHYKKWKSLIRNSKDFKIESEPFYSSWAKVSLVPKKPTALAGYGVRKGAKYSVIHDSIYVRAIALKSGNTEHFFVSADLLIIPPSIYKSLEEDLNKEKISIKNIHFSATHSHNSLGEWGNTLTGKVFAGNYNKETEDFIRNQIFKVILASRKNYLPASISYGEIVDSTHIRNRLNLPEFKKVDPEIRSILFRKSDGSVAKIHTYAAHSTVLNSATHALSRDYSGVWVDSDTTAFTLFMAGAVGSMGPVEKGKDDFDEVNNQGKGLFQSSQNIKFKEIKSEIVSDKYILPLAEPNPKISQDFGLRAFVFKYLFGDYPTHINVNKIGNVLLIGMPCDFSGELTPVLDAYAKSKGLQLMITSFNGSYIGYVTADEHFDKDLYETRIMAWFGPHNGTYFSEIVKDLIDKYAK